MLQWSTENGALSPILSNRRLQTIECYSRSSISDNRYQFLRGRLERFNSCRHLAAPQMTNAGHHRLLVNIQTSEMRMQKFHRSSCAPLAWSPDRRNLKRVLKGFRVDAHQSHTDLYALDAKTLYANTLARFIYRGSETPVGDCYESMVRRATARKSLVEKTIQNNP